MSKAAATARGNSESVSWRAVKPESPNGKEVVTPASRAEWRRWLANQSARTDGVWIAIPKKGAGVVGTAYADLVEESLCFGWIDGQAAPGTDRWRLLWFAPRRKGSVWARSNKERVERLTARGLMTERGQAVIDQAKADGSWSQYDDADALLIHGDLAEALAADPTASARFEALAPSNRKAHLWHVYSAKRPDTRAKRIAETVRRLRGE